MIKKASQYWKALSFITPFCRSFSNLPYASFMHWVPIIIISPSMNRKSSLFQHVRIHKVSHFIAYEPVISIFSNNLPLLYNSTYHQLNTQKSLHHNTCVTRKPHSSSHSIIYIYFTPHLYSLSLEWWMTRGKPQDTHTTLFPFPAVSSLARECYQRQGGSRRTHLSRCRCQDATIGWVSPPC